MNEINAPLTEQEKRELEALDEMTPVFDDDAPAMDDRQLAQFIRVNQIPRDGTVIPLSISQATLRKAQCYGDGYTSFLSRLLDMEIDDDELVRKCM